MRVVSHRKLRDYYESPGREDSRVALERWYEIASSSEWKNYAEMKNDFGSVDSVGNQHYVFNIKGNKYRLVVVTKFVMGCIIIRFVGTHTEYNEINASEV